MTSNIDFTTEHTMECGHEWKPGVSLCNVCIDKVTTSTVINGKRKTSSRRINCLKPAIWYCTNNIKYHRRVCSDHIDDKCHLN